MNTILTAIVVPVMFALGAGIIQKRTRTPWALWLSFALALVGGVSFAVSPPGETFSRVLGAWSLVPASLGALALAVAATDAMDGRPEMAATVSAFFTPMFVPGMIDSLDNPYVLALAAIIVAIVSEHRASGSRAGTIKWVSVVFALIGGVALLKTTWVTFALDWLPTWMPGAAGFIVILLFIIDVIADKQPDRTAVICSALLPALFPYGWLLIESGVSQAVS